MKTHLILVSSCLVCIGFGCPTAVPPQPEQPTVLNSETAPLDAPASDQETLAGRYLPYSQETVAAEQAEGQKVVLFFYAAWCPFCQEADAAFIERISEIPDGVTVLKTNYDTEKDLKKRYGVNYQHTFVQIDGAGNQVSKWVSGDIEALESNLK